MALPKWLDQVPNIDFSREKQVLEDIVDWSCSLGWTPVDPEGMEFSARSATDVALAKGEELIRIAVEPKSRTSQGSIRIQAVPFFRDAFLVWHPTRRKWQIELGSVPIDRTWDRSSFEWLMERLFAA
jgi:hypothetical protein